MFNPSRLTLLLLMVNFFSAHAFADTQAPITSVVLYQGSATIERTAQVNKGMTQVDIKGLPTNFDVATMRVDADAGISVGQIVSRDTQQSTAINPLDAELEAKIEALQEQKRTLDINAKSAGLVNDYLARLINAAGTEKSGVSDGKYVDNLLTTIQRETDAALGRIQEADRKKRAIDKNIAALNAELFGIRHATQRTVRNITVNLTARSGGSIRLSYQVNGAGWKPTYRAELDSMSSKVMLERMAVVSQHTGEDWNGVKLKLSTGQPNASLDAADPFPYLLSLVHVDPVKPPEAIVNINVGVRTSLQRSMNVKRHSAGNVEAITAEDVGRMPDKNIADSLQRLTGVNIPAPAPAYAPPVMEVQNAFTTEFEVPSEVSLPSDGREISVSLSTQALPVKQQLRITPRLDKNAVATADAERPEGVWLSGDMQLFRDGSYVGAAHWDTAASDHLVFPFGRDPLVRVTVNQANDKSGTRKGNAVQLAERKLADTYTITSSHQTPVDILVLESSPVSTSDKVVVKKIFSPAPTIEAWQQRQGIVGWEKTLGPRESLKINVDYTVSFPKGDSVAGLP